MNCAYRYRIYPTTEQRILFAKPFDAAGRFITSCCLIRSMAIRMPVNFLLSTPAKYKKDYPYLRKVDSLTLANKQQDLQAAFRNCFNKFQLL